MALILSAERTVQPQGAVGLNRRSPLARGLVSLIHPPGGFKDLVSGAVGTPTALAAGLTAKGKAWVFDGSSTLVDMNGLPPGLPDLSGIYTIAGIVIPNAASTARTFLQLRDSAARNAHIICGSTGVANVGVSSITASDGRVITAVNGGIYTVIGVGSNGAMLNALINGMVGTVPGAGGFTASTQVGYTLGKRIGGSTIDGRILLAAVWNRGLSLEEQLFFTRNPWQLLERTRNSISVGASSGSTHNLTGAATTQDAGSVSSAITQAHALAGASTAQAATSDTGVITQAHVLMGSATAQAATSGTGVIVVGGVHTLTGAATSQAATSGIGVITQAHVLIGSACTQVASSSSASITGPAAIFASRRSAKHIDAISRPASLSTRRRPWH